MKRIKIEKVDNGYVIYITSEGNQTPYDKQEVHIAKNKQEIFDILEEAIYE